MNEILVMGGGIGGLAAALACSRAGAGVRLYERAEAFAEVGAGIQLGPNAVRVLDGWGLLGALREVAAWPGQLQVCDARSGRTLGRMALGEQIQARYGQPYATVHRADLHRLLLQAVQGREHVRLQLGATLERCTDGEVQALAGFADGSTVQGDLLLGCDGLWSRVRQELLHDGPPRVTGHLAFRAMVPQAPLPARLRSQSVTAWLAPGLHVVQYPVRDGDWLNVVVIVQGSTALDAQGWDHGAMVADVRRALGPVCPALNALIEAIALWRFWVLQDREPLRAPARYHGHRMALLGDAAHPMRPYLAQGAAMALEDAQAMGRLLELAPGDLPALLPRYAAARCARNARVQTQAERNGRIFHAQGLLRGARDVGLSLLGERVMDSAWLYRGPEPVR